MANRKHLVLRIKGDYDDTALANEVWETQLRLALVFGNVDDVGTLPDNWEPTAYNISRVETDWEIVGNWTVGGPGLQTFEPDSYLNDQVAPAIIDWIPNMHLWQKVRVRELELYPCRDPKGQTVPAVPYAQGTPCRLTWTGAYPVGIGSTAPLPLQNSVVMSHKTLQPGAHGRGRMFMPPCTAGDTSATRLSTTAQNDMLEDHITFLQALAYDGTSGGSPVKVRPIVTGAPFTNYGVIKTVRVGNIIDTQRRRRNRLQETYVSDPVTY